MVETSTKKKLAKAQSMLRKKTFKSDSKSKKKSRVSKSRPRKKIIKDKSKSRKNKIIPEYSHLNNSKSKKIGGADEEYSDVDNYVKEKTLLQSLDTKICLKKLPKCEFREKCQPIRQEVNDNMKTIQESEHFKDNIDGIIRAPSEQNKSEQLEEQLEELKKQFEKERQIWETEQMETKTEQMEKIKSFIAPTINKILKILQILFKNLFKNEQEEFCRIKFEERNSELDTTLLKEEDKDNLKTYISENKDDRDKCKSLTGECNSTIIPGCTRGYFKRECYFDPKLANNPDVIDYHEGKNIKPTGTPPKCPKGLYLREYLHKPFCSSKQSDFIKSEYITQLARMIPFLLAIVKHVRQNNTNIAAVCDFITLMSSQVFSVRMSMQYLRDSFYYFPSIGSIIKEHAKSISFATFFIGVNYFCQTICKLGMQYFMDWTGTTKINLFGSEEFTFTNDSISEENTMKLHSGISELVQYYKDNPEFFSKKIKESLLPGFTMASMGSEEEYLFRSLLPTFLQSCKEKIELWLKEKKDIGETHEGHSNDPNMKDENFLFNIASIIICSLLFGVFHFINLLTPGSRTQDVFCQVCMTFVMGIFLQIIKSYTNLRTVVMTHWYHNFMITPISNLNLLGVAWWK